MWFQANITQVMQVVAEAVMCDIDRMYVDGPEHDVLRATRRTSRLYEHTLSSRGDDEVLVAD